MQQLMKLKIVSLVAVVLLTSAISTYAWQTESTMLDPGLQGAQTANLLTEIGTSQTLDDITVTLDWAYADAQRLAVGYTITGAEFSTDPAEPMLMPNTTLTNQGNIFSQRTGAFDPNLEPGVLQVVNTFYSQVLRPDGQADNAYFVNEFGSLPADLELQLEVNLVWMSPGGTGEINQSVGPFIFDFTAPLYPSVETEVMATVTAGEVAMRLEKVTTTPTQTSALICYTLPSAEDWRPGMLSSALVAGNGEPAMISGMSLTALPTPADEERCQEMSFDLFLGEQPPDLTLTIEEMEMSEPEGGNYWVQVQAALPEQDIVIEVNMGGGTSYNLISKPDDMTDEAFFEALHAARESLRGRIAGPWVFTVDIE